MKGSRYRRDLVFCCSMEGFSWSFMDFLMSNSDQHKRDMPLRDPEVDGWTDGHNCILGRNKICDSCKNQL